MIDHPYTYECYWSIEKIAIPNISFFINPNNKQNNITSNDIKSNTYNIEKLNNLNNISLLSEEDIFGIKKIGKGSDAILAATFKDYQFRANIIWFNKNINSFGFIKLPTKKIKKTIVKNTSAFLTKKINTKLMLFKLINKQDLTNLSSVANYPPNFNYHKSECFKTHLSFGNIRSISRNKTTYFVMPLIPIFFVSTIILITAIVKRRVIGNYFFRKYASTSNIHLLENNNWYIELASNRRPLNWSNQIDYNSRRVLKIHNNTPCDSPNDCLLNKYTKHGIVTLITNHATDMHFTPDINHAQYARNDIDVFDLSKNESNSVFKRKITHLCFNKKRKENDEIIDFKIANDENKVLRF